MKQNYLKFILVFSILISTHASAQVPAAWPGVVSQLGPIISTADSTINANWNDKYNYCTRFAGDLLLANSNRGYSLFTQTPPGPPDTVYENYLLKQVDTMLIMMDSLGYRSVDITISYPLLVDSFPNKSIYLDFYKNVYAMARNLGFKIIENCQVTLAGDSGAAEPNMISDIRKFYFAPNGVPDTLNTARYLSTMTQMMQTVIDSLTPDYLTLEMEPQTQQFNTFNLLNFTPDTTLMYVNYFLGHLTHKGNILFGAGAGTWNQINYFQNYATTGVDYLDYHLYPITGSFLNDMVFQVDSMAMANNKKIVVGECWLHKNTDSEYVYTSGLELDALDNERDLFNYFEGLDTQFIQMMINLSQQANIELVNFFNTPNEFGYLTYGPSYDSMSVAEITTIGTKLEYDNIFNMRLEPLGIFTRNAIARINCNDTTVNTGIKATASDIGINIYPNPASSQLIVSSDVSMQNIQVYDLVGHHILSMTVDNNTQETLDISSLSPAIYLVKILTANGYAVKKFVKED